MRASFLGPCAVLTLQACTGGAPTPSAPPPTEQAPAPAGSPFAAEAHVHLALYGLPGQDFAPEAAFSALLAERLPGLARFDGDAPTPQGPRVQVLTPLIDEFPPPPADALPYFSIGLSADQERGLPLADRVFVTEWTLATGSQGQGQLREVMGLWSALAGATGGVPWDDDTRQAFSVEAWSELRQAHWQGDLPRVDNHMNMHLYELDGRNRLVTIGMDKLGLPDLSIPDLIRNDSEVLGPLINAIAQTMIEGGQLSQGGELSVDLAGLQHAELREILQSYVVQGTGKAEIELREATPMQGDADNRLWELSFPGSGQAYYAAQIATLEGMFGNSEDGVIHMEHDEELLAASARSRDELLGMKAELQGHFDQGWALLVKGPFPTPSGGTEWMWVETRSWSGDAFQGLLINDPVEIPDLAYGAPVEVSEADLFDYRLDLPDGSTKGWHATRIQAARAGMEIE